MMNWNKSTITKFNTFDIMYSLIIQVFINTTVVCIQSDISHKLFSLRINKFIIQFLFSVILSFDPISILLYMYFLSKEMVLWSTVQDSWVLQGPGSSRILGPQGSWVLKGSGFSRVLQSPGSLFSGMPYSLFIFDVILHFKIPKMVQYNHRSLMISVNDAKHIHLLPIFRTFQSFSYCKYKPFINSFQSYLFLLLILVKLFFSNRVIDILYNLNKYKQC